MISMDPLTAAHAIASWRFSYTNTCRTRPYHHMLMQRVLQSHCSFTEAIARPQAVERTLRNESSDVWLFGSHLRNCRHDKDVRTRFMWSNMLEVSSATCWHANMPTSSFQLKVTFAGTTSRLRFSGK
jgi:hypothetical protein